MKNFVSILRQRCYKSSRTVILCLTILSLTLSSSGCGVKKSIDNAITEIERTKTTIAGESSAWRDELPKLADSLKGIESQAAGDAKGIIADTTNQVQDLATQTINLSEAKTNEILGNANAFVLCDAGFVKEGVSEQLQYLIDDLEFWKQNNKHLDKKPNHRVCVINPSALSLYPSGNNWSIDTSNMSGPNIMEVFGYNFWSQSLPTLELQDGNGNKIHDVNLTAAYVTHYQINLDFSNEGFAGIQPGARVVFRWPDQEDPNTISLTLSAPAKLKISDPTTWIFTPATPTAKQDLVTLKVSVTNVGDLRSGNFDVYWVPDPADPNSRQVLTSPRPLNPQESLEVSLPSYQYQRGGTITSTVSLSTGDDTQSMDLAIISPPPPTPIPIASAACPVPIDTIALPTPPADSTLYLSDNDVISVSYQQNLPPDRMSIVLNSDPSITWWKGLQLQDENFNVLSTVETHDGIHGPVPMTVTLQAGDKRSLIFFKAKFGGAHTQMHCAGDLTQLPGYTVTLTWMKD